jgi:hypothetical protein
MPPMETEAIHRRSSMRPVTGSIGSWGATAKSRDFRAKSAVGWVLGAFVAFAAGVVWYHRAPTTAAPPASAVLVTPTAVPATAPPASRAATVEGVPTEPAPSPASNEGAAAPLLSAPTVVAPTPVEIGPIAPLAESNRGTANRGAAFKAPIADVPSAPLPAPAVESEINPYLRAPAASTEPSTCRLHLNSVPSARVVLDGTPLGFTPKVGVVVSTGEHQVHFIWQDGDKYEAVRCARGETKTVAARLDDPPPVDDSPERNPYR